MNIIKHLAGLGLVALLAGCGTASILRPGEVHQTSDEESIVVFGLNPGYSIHLVPGERLSGGFRQSLMLGSVVNGQSIDGYLVAKMRPGQLVGLVSVFKKEEGNVLGTKAFTACGKRALVLEVPRAGRLYYVTDIEYTATGDRLSVRYANRMTGAAEYLHTKYPQLGGELEQLAFEYLPSLGGCGGGTVTIPIYIRR